MRRVGNLFPRIISFDNLYSAFQKAYRGAGGKGDAASFLYHIEPELFSIQRELEQDSYKPGGYRYFHVLEPKKRLIAEAPFRDRVVHHALVNILEPIYERVFITDSYATRKGKGTHRAILRAQQFIRRYPWYLKTDIQHCFGSVNTETLESILRRKIKDEVVLKLLHRILTADQSHPGLPIGNLTSQFLANVYLDQLDHWLKDELGIKGYLRYMDDFVLFAESKQALKDLLPSIESFLYENLRLHLKPGSVCINQRIHGLPFLGRRVFPGVIRIRRENKSRSLRHLEQKLLQYEAGEISDEQCVQSLRSLWGHLSYFANYKLSHSH